MTVNTLWNLASLMIKHMKNFDGCQEQCNNLTKSYKSLTSLFRITLLYKLLDRLRASLRLLGNPSLP